MTRYARIDDDKLVFPTASEFEGVPNWQTNDSAMRKRMYMPIRGDVDVPAGYIGTPSSWYVVNQSIQRMETRQVKIDGRDGNGNKIGEDYEMRTVPVVKDTSYIQIDGWNYTKIEVHEPDVNDAEFKVACRLFRDVCAQIGAFIGDENFRGGFEAYSKFISSSAARQSKASASLLASMWSGANEYCKYIAKRDMNLDQPYWWYKCWEYTQEELEGYGGLPSSSSEEQQ